MTNKDKIFLALGKLIDQINESLDKKEVPNAETLEALRALASLTGYPSIG